MALLRGAGARGGRQGSPAPGDGGDARCGAPPTIAARPDLPTPGCTVPVDGAVRNAFSLVQRRYRVPIARLVELAPYRLVLAAAASLARRKSKLLELHRKLQGAGELQASLPHLPSPLSPAHSELTAAAANSTETHDSRRPAHCVAVRAAARMPREPGRGTRRDHRPARLLNRIRARHQGA